ncbi:MAG: hypothetical protein IJD92_01765 [Bacilli bacterium]|nr:hypothetical protein [Bacilli bacterium]
MVKNIDNNIKNIIDILKLLKTEKTYKEDLNIINNLYREFEILLQTEKIEEINLEIINENINYLDQKYDNLYDLVNLYSLIYIYYKKIIHKNYVNNLRNNNRERKMKKNG